MRDSNVKLRRINKAVSTCSKTRSSLATVKRQSLRSNLSIVYQSLISQSRFSQLQNFRKRCPAPKIEESRQLPNVLARRRVNYFSLALYRVFYLCPGIGHNPRQYLKSRVKIKGPSELHDKAVVHTSRVVCSWLQTKFVSVIPCLFLRDSPRLTYQRRPATPSFGLSPRRTSCLYAVCN